MTVDRVQNKKRVDENLPIGKKTDRLRQDRTPVGENSFFLDLGGTLCQVVNFSPFGVAVKTNTSFQESLPLERVPFLVQGVPIQHLDLRWVRTEKTPEDSVTAFEVTGSPLCMCRAEAVQVAAGVLRQHHAWIEDGLQVPEAFRRKVYEVKEHLLRLRENVNALSAGAPETGKEDLAEFEGGVAQVIAGFLTSMLPRADDELLALLKGADPVCHAAAKAFFRSQLGEILHQAPFARRSFNKPRGYAGDYEIMNQIYRDDEEGYDLFAKSLHRYYLDQPPARAVRNRTAYLISRIKDLWASKRPGEPLRILSVGSGPAREIQELLRGTTRERGKDLEVYLLDQDTESLKYAQRQLKKIMYETGVRCDIHYINQTIVELILKGFPFNGLDLVYSTGLFDYLEDPLCKRVARKLYNVLRSGGQLIIGNFNVDNPSRPTMEFALAWDLIYRSAADLKRLYSGLGGRLDVEQEKEGVNLFCVISRPSP